MSTENYWNLNSNLWIEYVNDNKNIEGNNNKIRLAYPIIQKLIPSNSKIIDLGCGEGHFLRTINNKYKIGIGLDNSSKLIEYAKQQSDNQGIHFIVCSGDDVSFSENTFDVGLSIMTLLWIENYEDHLKEKYRIIKPNGNAILAIPHPYSFQTGNIEFINDKPIIKITEELAPSMKSVKIGDELPLLKYYRRSISDYVNASIDVGFKIEKMYEPLYDLVEGMRFPYFLILNLKK